MRWPPESGLGPPTEPVLSIGFVMAGLDPAIHVFRAATHLRRGCPGHLARRRASRFCPGMKKIGPHLSLRFFNAYRLYRDDCRERDGL
jgi:hypothetical protein